MKRLREKSSKPSPEADSRGDSDMHLCLLCSKKIRGLEAYVQHRQNGCEPDSLTSSQSSDSKPAAEGTASTTADSSSSLPPPTKSKSVLRRCEECGIDFRSRRSHAEHVDLAHRSPLFTPSCSRGERKFSKRKTRFKTAVDRSLWSGVDSVDDDALQSDGDELGEVEASISVDINVEAVPGPAAVEKERVDIAGRIQEWMAPEQDLDFEELMGSEIIDEEVCDQEVVECPLCGPISATGLAAHIFSPEHIILYHAFRGKDLPSRLSQDLSSSAKNPNLECADGCPDAANTASHLVEEGESAVMESACRADNAAASDHVVLDAEEDISESNTEPRAAPASSDVQGGSGSPRVLLTDRTDDYPNMEVVVSEPAGGIAAAYAAFTPATTETEIIQGDITSDNCASADVTPADDADKALRVDALTLSGVLWSAPFAPFRCHPCRFSCNRLSDLRRHAGSQGHWLRRSEKRCSLCGGDVAGPEHFDDEEHRAGASKPLSILGIMPYHCGVCSRPLRLRVAAARHLRRRHGAAGAFVCDTCGAAVPQRDAAAHQARHGLPQRCDTCGKLLTTPRAVERHYRSSVCQYLGYIREGKIKCRHCSFRNNLKVNVLFHEAVSHLPTQTDSARPGRGRRGTSKSVSSRKAGIRYLCPECNVYFRKSTLRPHLMKHTGEAPFHCIYCSRYFYVESECERHERLSHRHRRDEEQRSVAKATLAGVPRAAYCGLKCQLCGEGFPTGTALRMHERRKHRGEERLCPAPDCSFQTRNTTLLSRHLVKSHPQFRRFRCHLCDFACTSAAALETHSYKHSGLKPYRCEHCEFATRFPAHLKRHLRIHTGARPYPCPFCEYKANNFENLRKHVISTGRHQGLSVYMCKFCPEGALFGTNFAREFKQHLRQQHAGEFKSVGALATYVAGLYNQEEDVIETDQPIDHTYKQRSQTAKPRRAVVRRARAGPAGTSSPRVPTLAVTVMPVKGYRALRTVRLPLLASRAKTALLSPAAEAKQGEPEGAAPAIDCEDVPDAVTLQVAPPDCTLGDVSEHQFTASPLGRSSWQRSREEEVDDPAEPSVGPTRFSGDATMTEAPVPQVHVEDAAVRSSVHRTTLVKSSADSPDSEIISLETNFPTEITAVHSEETGDCSSLLMTFLTDRGSRHVMVPRDVVIHKPGAPVFSRIRVDFVPGDTEGTDKVTIHRFC